MKRMMTAGVLVAVSCVAACSVGSSNKNDGASSDSNIGIDPNTESPATVLGSSYVTKLQALVPAGDIGQSFGLDDNHIPYPDTYWPFKYTDDATDLTTINGIDARWQGADQISPLEKYMGLLDSGNLDAAKKWEADNHGINVPNVASWFGHCPGWTGASMVNAPLQQGVSAKADDSGNFVKCDAGSDGCTTFDIGDINALEAEVFVDGDSAFIGARCDTAPADVPRDENGRVTKSGCRGLNPGSVMVVLANRMKNVKNDANFVPQAIAIDAQNDANTDQIWNQPSYRYTVNDAGPLAMADALKLIVKPGAPVPTTYTYNADAKGWYHVDISISWVSENGPNRQMVSGADSTRQMHFAAVLELDGDPSSPDTNIIGGEFLDDPNAGTSRLTVPPFMWTTTGPGPEDSQDHNPYVKSSKVQQLVQLALQQ